MRALLVALALSSAACGDASRPALVPLAQTVVIGKEAPGEGARVVGPVEATHGGGCGVFAETGNAEGAAVLLRNKVAEMGGNFVQVTDVTEPHAEPTCFSGGYVVKGTAYFIQPDRGGAPGVPPSPRAPSATPEAAPEPPRPGACDPLCSPGFECKEGQCRPLCNPPCEANEVCNRHRACEPAPAGASSIPRSTVALPAASPAPAAPSGPRSTLVLPDAGAHP